MWREHLPLGVSATIPIAEALLACCSPDPRRPDGANVFHTLTHYYCYCYCYCYSNSFSYFYFYFYFYFCCCCCCCCCCYYY